MIQTQLMTRPTRQERREKRIYHQTGLNSIQSVSPESMRAHFVQQPQQPAEEPNYQISGSQISHSIDQNDSSVLYDSNLDRYVINKNRNSFPIGELNQNPIYSSQDSQILSDQAKKRFSTPVELGNSHINLEKSFEVRDISPFPNANNFIKKKKGKKLFLKGSLQRIKQRIVKEGGLSESDKAQTRKKVKILNSKIDELIAKTQKTFSDLKKNGVMLTPRSWNSASPLISAKLIRKVDPKVEVKISEFQTFDFQDLSNEAFNSKMPSCQNENPFYYKNDEVEEQSPYKNNLNMKSRVENNSSSNNLEASENKSYLSSMMKQRYNDFNEYQNENGEVRVKGPAVVVADDYYTKNQNEENSQESFNQIPGIGYQENEEIREPAINLERNQLNKIEECNDEDLVSQNFSSPSLKGSPFKSSIKNDTELERRVKVDQFSVNINEENLLKGQSKGNVDDFIDQLNNEKEEMTVYQLNEALGDDMPPPPDEGIDYSLTVHQINNLIASILL